MLQTWSRLGDLSNSVLTGTLNLGSVLLERTFVGLFVGVSDVDITGRRDNTDSREVALVRGGDRIMVDPSAWQWGRNTSMWELSSPLVDEVVGTMIVGADARVGVLGWVSRGEEPLLMRLPVLSFVRHLLFFPDTGVCTMGRGFFFCFLCTVTWNQYTSIKCQCYMYVYCSEQTAETNFLSYREILSKFDIVGQYSIKSGDLFTFCP